MAKLEQPVILCIDCFIDNKQNVPAEFVIMGTAVCKVHAAMRRKRMIHG